MTEDGHHTASCYITVPNNEVTVTFEYNGATGNNTTNQKTVEKKGTYGILPTPTKERFTFEGWYKEPDFTNRVTDSTIVEAQENHTLYAKWEIDKSKTKVYIYNHYNQNLSNPAEYNLIYYGSNMIGIPNVAFERNGYKFGGYYANTKDGNRIELLAGGQISEEIFNEIVNTNNNSIMLYCKWIENPTVTFEYNGATGGNQQASKNVVQGEAYGDLPVPTKTGHRFKGWYKEKECINKIDVSTIVETQENHTIYAKWEAYILIQFNTNSDDVVEDFYIVNEEDKDKSMPILERGPYGNFLGWYLEGKKITKYRDIDFRDDDYGKRIIKLSANWTDNGKPTYTISFDSNGGTGSMGYEIFSINEQYVLPENTFTRDGYKFVKWHTTPEGKGGTDYEDKEKIENIGTNTLYAQWEKVAVPVTSININTQEITLELGKTYQLEVDITPSNATYKEVTWTSSNETVATVENGLVTAKQEGTATITAKTVEGKKVTCTVTVIKEKIEETYVVKFDANEGTGTMEDQIFTKNKAQNLLPNRFEREGYQFVEWNTKKDGTGENYADEVSVTNLTTSDTITLYAQWGKKGTTVELTIIKHETNGGEPLSDKTINIATDSNTWGTIPNPKKEGYKFEGWYTESDFRTEIEKYSDLKLEEGKTYTIYAKWEKGGTGDNPGGDNPGGDNPGGDNPGGDNPGGNNPGGQNPGQTDPKGNTTKTNNTVVSGDKTITSLKMPKTGSSIILPIIIVTIAAIIVGLYFKLKSLRDVK